LLNGYLQQGNLNVAKNMVDSMQQYCTELPSPLARTHAIYLTSTYLAETGNYSALAELPFTSKDLNIQTRARNSFINGMAAYQKNDVEKLEDIIRKLKGDRLIEQEKITGNEIRICGSINRSMPTLSDLQKTEVIELQLTAMKSWLQKDTITTEKFLQQATAMEENSTYDYGPPTVVKPSFEMYGEWLLEMKKPKEALIQFEKSLDLAPNKSLSLKGKESAINTLN